MTPNENGRHCSSCAKTVIDFRAFTDEQVQNYFISNHQQAVCGRFKATQLHRIVINLPGNILHINMPLWKKFLVASLLIFGTTVFPFETTIAGIQDSTVAIHPDSPATALIDTPKHPEPIKFTIDIPEIKYIPPEIITTTLNCERFLSGFTVIVPDSVRPEQEAAATVMIMGDIFVPEPKSPDSFLKPVESNDLPGTMSANSKPAGSNELPEQPNAPYIPTAFILPALPAFKRKK